MKLEDKIWLTGRIRIEAEKRLLRISFHSRVLLLWYSAFGLGVAIYNLTVGMDAPMQSVSWLIYSALILAASALVQGFRVGERAEMMKQCYVQLQELSGDLTLGGVSKKDAAARYIKILASFENHKTSDYYAARCLDYLNAKDKTAVAEIVPSCTVWMAFFRAVFLRFLAFTFLYSMPIILLGILRCCYEH